MAVPRHRYGPLACAAVCARENRLENAVFCETFLRRNSNDQDMIGTLEDLSTENQVDTHTDNYIYNASSRRRRVQLRSSAIIMDAQSLYAFDVRGYCVLSDVLARPTLDVLNAEVLRAALEMRDDDSAFMCAPPEVYTITLCRAVSSGGLCVPAQSHVAHGWCMTGYPHLLLEYSNTGAWLPGWLGARMQLGRPLGADEGQHGRTAREKGPVVREHPVGAAPVGAACHRPHRLARARADDAVRRTLPARPLLCTSARLPTRGNLPSASALSRTAHNRA